MSRIAREYPDREDLWDAPPIPVRAFPNRCACSHGEGYHGTDRKGRFQCFHVVCACTEFRPKENDQ